MSKKSKPIQWVYLVGSPLVTPVKIGTSRRPAERLADLQVGSPVPLSLLWKTPGTRDLERMLHDYFVHYRTHGEWFDFGTLNPIAAVTGALSLFGYRQAVSPAPAPERLVIAEIEPVATEVVPAPRSPACMEAPAGEPSRVDPDTNAGRVLRSIQGGATTNRQVADETGLNKGTVSTVIQRLITDGHVTRTEDGLKAKGDAA